jgi:hypothetical protein
MSKKLLALFSGALLVAASHLLLDGPAAKDVAEKATALFVAYLLGQGVADHGKEAARLRTPNASPLSHSSDTVPGNESA